MTKGRKNRHLRDLKSRRFHEEVLTKTVRDITNRSIIPRLKFRGYKRGRKRQIAWHCIHNLVLAGSVNKTVADSRDTSVPGVQLRISIWDAIVKANLATVCKGSEYSHKTTRYYATQRLLRLFCDKPACELVNSNLQRLQEMSERPTQFSLIELRTKIDGKKKPIAIPVDQLQLTIHGVRIIDYLETVEADIETINRSNLRHTWQAFKIIERDGRKVRRAFQPSVVIKQIHSGTLLRYARLYTWSELSAQNLTKEERRLMLIDGEPIAELDYREYHLRMLYHLTGIDPDPEQDLYRPKAVFRRQSRLVRFARYADTARRLVKTATNICFNTSAEMKAAKAVKKYAEETDARKLLELEGIRCLALVRRIKATHRAISRHFCTQIGAWLQTVDAMVMLRVLKSFANADKPALCLHDGILCKASDAGFADAFMSICYSELFGFCPAIRRVV